MASVVVTISRYAKIIFGTSLYNIIMSTSRDRYLMLIDYRTCWATFWRGIFRFSHLTWLSLNFDRPKRYADFVWRRYNTSSWTFNIHIQVRWDGVDFVSISFTLMLNQIATILRWSVVRLCITVMICYDVLDNNYEWSQLRLRWFLISVQWDEFILYSYPAFESPQYGHMETSTWRRVRIFRAHLGRSLDHAHVDLQASYSRSTNNGW